MIRVISGRPREWSATCKHCRCEFAYEYEDLIRKHNSEQRPSWIPCPSCGDMCTHMLSSPIKDAPTSTTEPS